MRFVAATSRRRPGIADAGVGVAVDVCNRGEEDRVTSPTGCFPLGLEASRVKTRLSARRWLLAAIRQVQQSLLPLKAHPPASVGPAGACPCVSRPTCASSPSRTCRPPTGTKTPHHGFLRRPAFQ